MRLIRPSTEHLPGIEQALERGWTPNSLRGAAATREELERLRRDPVAYLAGVEDRAARNPPWLLPDGSAVAALPSLRRWAWDGEFCGTFVLRWQLGTMELPPEIPGHVGYSIVPWKRGLGYARAGLAQFLPYARHEGLPHVDLTTDPDNLASRRVIEANGGVLIERFVRCAAFGGTTALKYRIHLR